MDFSGQKSRVIDNPTEALSVAVEEGLAWRVQISSCSLKTLTISVCFTQKVEMCFFFLYAEKSVLTPGHPQQPQVLFTEICHKHGYVCICTGIAWEGIQTQSLRGHGGKFILLNCDPFIQSFVFLPSVSLAIHRSQPWFHHRISRDEAQRLIIQQGLVDG